MYENKEQADTCGKLISPTLRGKGEGMRTEGHALPLNLSATHM